MIKKLRILHFNDVYHVAASQAEPVGGAARFGYLIHELQKQKGPVLTLFSGDAYFPSLESTISRGEHMVPILNQLNIDASTLGNHEFDHGLQVLEQLIARNNFPWVISNLTDSEHGGVAARGCLPYLVKETQDLRVGILGIVEKEWLDTLPCLPPTFQYHDFITKAQETARMLKQDKECDIVVCLSHMRLGNDIKLADQCVDVDVVLSGHDHFYYVGSGVDEFEDPDAKLLAQSNKEDEEMLKAWEQERQLQGKRRRLVKSGTDFRDLSEIELQLGRQEDGMRVMHMHVRRHRVLGQTPEDPEISQMVEKIERHLSRALDKPIGFTTTSLDARSSVCRTQESNLGSLSADLMRYCYKQSTGAQIGLLCGGAIRSDRVISDGPLRMREIMEAFPFEDPVVVVRLTGDQIRRALENGVSKWPAHEGRFPQVSGIRFEFDPRRQPGDRIIQITNVEGPQADLDMEAEYVVATRDYMYQGHDGYTMLGEGKLLVDEENGITFVDLFRRYFQGLAVCNALQFRLRGHARSCSEARNKEPTSKWRDLIIKHASGLRELSQQSEASSVADIVQRYSDTLARESTQGSQKIAQALSDSARRLDAEQQPIHIARAALFGNEKSVPESGRETPRNDDSGGLLPGLPINRSDTRTYASESVLAQWAVISPVTDGRIVNVDASACPDI
ncbi:hypothetical protein IWW36_000266 [Coemansia brasiliensis]|uniref:5'-nucleotidase n=1 Tax=Coemansia brasiliensis TaxID=2650707 RepID=A0A9W8M022_9FUNG|nr:hypothetical protein IWW36_000266 [Coemansia brasiliensis]